MARAAKAHFDTLEYAKKLEGAGVTQQQAEAQAEALSDVLSGLGVTDQSDLDNLSKDIDSKLSRLESKLITWIVGLLFAQTAIIISMIKFSH